MKFELGWLTVTCEVSERMENDELFHGFVMDSIDRYCSCNWGDISENDKKANTKAVCAGDERILAAYKNKELKTNIWILTAADRGMTTVMFPHEY